MKKRSPVPPRAHVVFFGCFFFNAVSFLFYCLQAFFMCTSTFVNLILYTPRPKKKPGGQKTTKAKEAGSILIMKMQLRVPAHSNLFKLIVGNCTPLNTINSYSVLFFSLVLCANLMLKFYCHVILHLQRKLEFRIFANSFRRSINLLMTQNPNHQPLDGFFCL